MENNDEYEKLFSLMIQRALQHRLKDIKNYCLKNNLTLEQAKDEILNKKSKLSSSNRTVLKEFLISDLEKWIDLPKQDNVI